MVLAAAYSIGGGWNIALAAGSVVLLTGGLTAMFKKALRPGQAIAVLATALLVGFVSLLASGFPGGFSVVIILAMIVGGIAIAAAVVARPANTRRY